MRSKILILIVISILIILIFSSCKKNEDDIYISILKYGLKNPGFTMQDLIEKFPDHAEAINMELGRRNIFVYSEDSFAKGGYKNAKYYVSFNDRFLLMEHEQLIEARNSSRKAMYIATFSIFLNIIILIFKKCNKTQSNTPIRKRKQEAINRKSKEIKKQATD